MKLSEIKPEINLVENITFEISNTLTQFEQALAQDSLMVDQIVELAHETENNIEKSNKNLNGINNNSSSLVQKLIVFAFIFLGIAILIMDL
jgi:t-SNARE complex subunit (syntaxin)